MKHLRTPLLALLALIAAVTMAACGSDSGSDEPSAATDTTAPPAQVTWVSWQGARLPVSATDGPAKVTGDLATGYSNTPQGAALAAFQGTIRLSLAPDESWAQVANKLVAPGTGRDTYAVNRALVSVSGPAPQGTAPIVRGYKFTSYSPQRADVSLAVEQDGTLAAAQQTVVWTGADWRVLLPEPGHEPTPTPLANLEGFVSLTE
ncbi:hypothetical protein [Williamsia sp. 1135]|uniref:hypothetical protein n=1 Tax=Williamsia sp. 1135 TaxID=1889262 RepID=UPI00117C1C45|nr:hypothetical protein [Williamsia sp. 1135]